MSKNPSIRITSIALFAALALPASPHLFAGSAADEVRVEGAYARAVPPGQANSAAFLTLTNGSAVDHALVAAASDASKVVELHTHRMEGGMMEMRRVDKIDLPAGGSVALAPGGLHIMLIGLAHDLSAGDAVALELVYEDGSRASIEVPVKTVQQTMEHGGHHQE